MFTRGTLLRRGQVVVFFVAPLAALAILVGFAASWGARSYFSQDASSAVATREGISQAATSSPPTIRPTPSATGATKLPSTPPPSAATPSPSAAVASTAPSSVRDVEAVRPSRLTAAAPGAAAPAPKAAPGGTAAPRAPAQVSAAPARAEPSAFANLATGFCLDSNRETGYTLGCNGTDYQKWTAYGYGEIILINKATSLCLASDSDGRAYPATCANSGRQRWTMHDAGYGTITVVNVASGRCLDSNADRQLYTMDCNGGSYQRWDRG